MLKPATWFPIALALLGVCILLLMTWLWTRAKPGSGDALFLPMGILMAASLLVGLIPRLLWPDHDAVRITAMIVSVAMAITALVWIRRTARKLLATRQG